MKDGIHSKVGYNCGKVEIVLDLVLIVVDIYSVCYYWCLLCARPFKSARVS